MIDTKALLESLLESGKELAEKGRDLAEDKMALPESGPEREAAISGLKKGAAITGVLALLLGTRTGRKVTGSAVKLGTLAALGGVAYKTYQNWQKSQGEGEPQALGTSIAELSGPAVNDRSLLLIRAMIAAAKADGHIDDQERAKIGEQLGQMQLESAMADFLKEELDRPATAAEIAAGVDSPAAAAEVYLASRMVIDVDNLSERAYLDELAQALRLPTPLTAQIEAEVA